MCNYLMKTGEFCQKAKSMDRCSKHPIDKFKPHITNNSIAEGKMKKIFNSRLEDTVDCPCGTTTRRWNYAHHCQFPKHKAWMKTMPKPVIVRSWTTTTLEE